MAALLIAFIVFIAEGVGNHSNYTATTLCYRILGDAAPAISAGTLVDHGQETVEVGMRTLNQGAADLAASSTLARSHGFDALSQDALTMRAALQSYAADLSAENPATNLTDMKRVLASENAVSSDCTTLDGR